VRLRWGWKKPELEQLCSLPPGLRVHSLPALLVTSRPCSGKEGDAQALKSDQHGSDFSPCWPCLLEPMLDAGTHLWEGRDCSYFAGWCEDKMKSWDSVPSREPGTHHQCLMYGRHWWK
jgi:hypothetical protein